MATVNLKKSYARLNEALMDQMDSSGIKRSFTVPYLSQPTADHIQAVGQAASHTGGATKNLIFTAHHGDGKGWGHPEGETAGFPADKLRSTIIPPKSEDAKNTIEAAQTHLNNIKQLVGDKNPAVLTAQSQLNLVKKSSGSGMNLADFGIMMIQIMHKPNQMIAQLHDQTKPGGVHPKLRGPAQGTPQNGQEPPQEAAGGAVGGENGSEGSGQPPMAPTAPQAPVPVSAPPQVQG